MLQCVAVCCSVLQCVAVSCSVLQCVLCFITMAIVHSLLGSVLRCAAVCCNVLQCAAVCCNVLQCAAVCHSVASNCTVLSLKEMIFCKRDDILHILVCTYQRYKFMQTYVLYGSLLQKTPIKETIFCKREL